MAKQNGSTLIIEALKANPGATIAQLAEATGMTTNGASATISNINRIADNIGLRIVGSKIPGSASYSYVLQYLAQPAPELAEKPRVVAQAMMEPSIEQSSEHLAQYIAGQMRAEFDARLAVVLRPAIEAGITAMMSNIRAAMADAFKLPESIAPHVVDASLPVVDCSAPAVKAEPVAGVSKSISESLAIAASKPTPSSPILNVVSTRTKHRERTKEESLASPAAPVAKSVGKQKVIICSLLPAQKEIIAREFGDCFDLRMYHKDQEKSLRKAINHGDTVMLMGDFLGHSVFQMVDAQGGTIITVKGGLTHLREALTSLYCDNKVAA